MTTLVLTAHGSADPRSAANARAIAGHLVRMRPGLDVRLAFCEHNSPSLAQVLAGLAAEHHAPKAVVTPLLLANAYHARIDIPGQIANCTNDVSGIHVSQAAVLGEDDRLVSVLRQRVTELRTTRLDPTLGVLVVSIGSSNRAANARTGRVAPKLATGTCWAAVTTAFATRPEPSLAGAVEQLRSRRRSPSDHRALVSGTRSSARPGTALRTQREHRDGSTAGRPPAGGRYRARPL